MEGIVLYKGRQLIIYLRIKLVQKNYKLLVEIEKLLEIFEKFCFCFYYNKYISICHIFFPITHNSQGENISPLHYFSWLRIQMVA